jgi:hypothetical protein
LWRGKPPICVPAGSTGVIDRDFWRAGIYAGAGAVLSFLAIILL